MEFSDLPEGIRVKLDESGEGELWHRVDEFGGVAAFSDAFDISDSKLYNWKNKDVFYPVGFVRRIMGDNASDDIIALKGEGRSLPLDDPRFPLEVENELLTRISESVFVNRDGVPVYRAERSLVDRFSQLLSEIGEIPLSVYRRSGYELRYPKYLHEIFSCIEFEPDFAVLVDETGRIEDGKVIAGGKSVRVEEFEGELYSREKKFQLALARNDSTTIQEMVAEEAENVSQAFR